VIGALVLAGLAATLALVTAYKANVNVNIDTPTVQSGLEKDARLKLWRYSAERVAEAPIAGHGFGRGILRGTLQSTLHDRLLWHGHNIFLNVLLQTGVLGLAAFLALLAALASRFIVYLGARSPELNAIGMIGLAFLAGFLVKNLTDDFFIRHTGLLFWSMNGMLLGYGERLLARGPSAGQARA
jgi:putative inorganic carbon (hco3(-)) transporter